MGEGRSGRTYVFLGDISDVPDVHDLALVPHHAHGDGVLAHLGGDVAVHLDAQVLQHQQACGERGWGGRCTDHGPPGPVTTTVPLPCTPPSAEPPGQRRRRGLPMGISDPGVPQVAQVCAPAAYTPVGAGRPCPEAGQLWCPTPFFPRCWSQGGSLQGLLSRGPQPTCGDAIEEREHPDGLPLLGRHRRIHLGWVLKAMGGCQAGRGDMAGSREGGRGGQGGARLWGPAAGSLTNSWSWLLAKNIWRREGQSSRRRSSP